MSTQTGISTVANFHSMEVEKISICTRPQINPAYRKLFTSTQKDTAETFLKSMMSSSDDMFDTNEVNTHLQSSFMNLKKMNHHQCN